MAANLNVEIIVRAKDLASQTLEQVGNTAQKVGNGISGTLAKNFKAAGLAAGVALGSITALGKSMVDVASSMEQNRVAFETMLGSAERAGTLLKKISDFAVRTPFELPEVVTASKQLLAMGSTADEVIPELKMLGDVSAGLGVPMERLILNFGQVRAQGKLTGREIRDFAVAGVPILEALADQMGKTKQEITEMASAGKISFEEVKKAFETMTGPGGRFFNLMEKQAMTFGGVMSNIRDQVTRFTMEIAGISTSGEIRENSLFAVLKKAADALLNALNVLQPIMVNFFTFLTSNKEVVLAIGGAIGGLFVLAIGALVAAFSGALLVMVAFMAAGALIAVLASKVIEAWGPFRDWFVNLWNQLIAGFNYLKENWSKIILEDIPRLAGEGLAKALSAIINFGLESVARWVKMLQDLVTATIEAGPKIKDAFLAIGRWIVETIKDHLNKSIDEIKAFPGKVADALRGAWQSIKSFASGFGGSFKIEMPQFQTGGVVPGPVGEAMPVMAHAGERILNQPQAAVLGAGTGGQAVNFNVYIGMYAGTPTEKRRIALELMHEVANVARATNKSLEEFVRFR